MENKRIELLLERTFLYDPNIYMSVVLTIEGDVTTDELCEAVNKTYASNQTTRSKIVLDEEGRVYMEETGETGCKVFVDKRDWLEILRDNERIPFRINEGELVRTFIIPRGRETDLYLMAHHIAGDGNAMMILAEDIFNHLDGKKVDYKPTRVMTSDEVIERGNLSLLEKIGLKNLSQKWGEDRKVFDWDDYYDIHETFWKNKYTDIVLKEMDEASLSYLREECKKLNVTINTYLVAKLMKENYPDSKKQGIPISIREGDKSISCLVSSATPYCRYDTDKNFVENLVKINKVITKELKDEGVVYRIPQFVAISDPTLIYAAYLHNIKRDSTSKQVDRMATILGLYGKDRCDLGVTNLREIRFSSEYERFKITRVIPFAPLIATTEHLFTISTYNGKMLIIETKLRNK